MPHGRAYTVISRVTTPDDDNILALRVYVVIILKLGVQKRCGVQLIITR